MRPHVLILSGLYDFSADLVALQLGRAGVPYVRLNREQLSDYRLTLDPMAPCLTIEGPVGTWVVGIGLRSVWFRQPVFLRNAPPIPLSPNEQLERSQWTAFLRGLCVFRDAAWMNHPQATYLAESKPYQLFVAAACGFRVPETLATNNVSRIRQTFPESLIIKSLDTVLLREGDDCLFTYTTVSSGAALRDESVAGAPLIAQRILGQKTDLLVTVVGNRLFAVRILSAGSGIAGDWRVIPKTNLEYQDMDLDTDTVDRCIHLTRQLGLTFAAIDLLETPEGIFFIEVNPTGEWGWLSGTDRPIDEAIAAWLANPSHHLS
jgi:glutathione synthase/RimK-type ligase-like ATP-grasp enzyme